MANELLVVAVFKVNAESVNAAKGLLAELAVPSRLEPGCIDYGFVQDKSDKSVILSVERWRDEAAFTNHLATDHFRSAFERLRPMLRAEPAIHRCERIV